jgi:hypothetical protein
MTVRLRYHIEASVSSSTAECKDLGNVCLDVRTDSPNEGGIWKTRVAAGATVNIPLDSITEAVFLFLRIFAADPTQTLTPVDITLNGTATLRLAPVGNARESNFLITSDGLTSLEVANTDAAAVPVDIIIGTAGD